MAREKREAVIGCLAYAIGIGIPGCIFAWMVVPVAFLVGKDLKTTGAALLLPNQPKESVEAAISDVLPLDSAQINAGYVEGSCEELLKMGLRNFFPDEPNYTVERDPDDDQLACEDPVSR